MYFKAIIQYTASNWNNHLKQNTEKLKSEDFLQISIED